MHPTLFPLRSRLAAAATGILLSSGGGALLETGCGAEGSIDYNLQVRPILSGNCFACHGPDANAREAGLRLDTHGGATAERDGVRAIVPGAPEASALVERILSEDSGEVMPPPEAHKKLTGAQKETLVRWIREGAEYKEHWAFVPPVKAALPAVPDPSRVRNGIDHFVLATLARENLEPLEEAGRETLIRRVTFDLTGLPPTPEAVDAFCRDSSPRAYEELVDRLLASRQFGERMALAWMDAARYGDTSVMHADGERYMWPWRDWVIDAYNDNKPFDQFTVEQIAGDLLPEATTEQKVATGFNRNHATSDEGGAIPEELRVEYVVDRVKTTSNVWMALTMECGQCHDHKYDPVSQREYYRMFAYFNNMADPGMQTRNGNQAPLVQVFRPEEKRRQAELLALAARLREERATFIPDPEEVEAWAAGLKAGGEALPLLGAWKTLGPFKANDAKHGFNHDFGPEKELALDAEQGGKQWRDAPAEWLEDGKVHYIDNPESHALYFHRTITVERQQIVPVSLGSDDSVKAWLNGKQVVANDIHRIAAPGQERTNLVLSPGENHFLMKVVNHDGAAAFCFDLGASGLPDDIRSIIADAPEAPDEAQRGALREYFTRHIWPAGQELDARIADAEREEKELVGRVPTSMVMGDNTGEPRVTYVLERGHYDSPLQDQPVEPGVPEVLPPLPEDAPRNRLGLARWLVAGDHPLTARVAVNRYWAMLFGRGLVGTVMDFGSQGDVPSHPQLLDWLAVDFVESGWDIKRAIRQIVTSATYRQSSRIPGHLRKLDPDNRLLARGPRFRLEGEFIRDGALAVSGLLVKEIGGPGVKPYQPDGLWNEVSLNGGLRFRRDDGDKLYRRSMYTFWKRSAPAPSMTIFDTPSREKCVVVRDRTNTPLQALVTLNDVQFLEASRVLAERLMKEGGEDFGSRVALAFKLAVAREPAAAEVATCRRVFDHQLASFRSDPAAAEKYLASGEAPRDAAIEAAELAAWAVLANMILNLDEFVTRG